MIIMVKNILIVVDMQNDFIDGALANPEAQKIVPKIAELIKADMFDEVICTMDIHNADYLDTSEGKKLPILHCIANTDGAKIASDIRQAIIYRSFYGLEYNFILKNTFATDDLLPLLKKRVANCEAATFTFVGTCTDICVVSNALAVVNKIPNTEVEVIAEACAGTTIKNHNAALAVMKSCQINIV